MPYKNLLLYQNSEIAVVFVRVSSQKQTQQTMTCCLFRATSIEIIKSSKKIENRKQFIVYEQVQIVLRLLKYENEKGTMPAVDTAEDKNKEGTIPAAVDTVEDKK